MKLCKEYAILAVSQLILMGKEEFLSSRMSTLSEFIEKNKPGVVDRDTVQPIPEPPKQPRRRSTSKRRSTPSGSDEEPHARNRKRVRRNEKGSSSSAPRPSSSGRAHADRQRSRTPVRQVHLEPNKISGLW